MKRKISRLQQKISTAKTIINKSERFYKNKPKLSNDSHYNQGLYTPLNKDKYSGKLDNIVYRSGLELKWFRFFDLNPYIINWVCEEYVVGYINPLDNEQHKYFIDVFIRYRTQKNEVKEALIEIKPLDQTRPPVKKKRITKSYRYAVRQYIVNEAKWNYASKIAEKHNIDFKILTETGFVKWNRTY